MKNALICYFTGTGNAERASFIIRDHLAHKGYNVFAERVESKNGSIARTEKIDLLVVVFSVLAWGASTSMRRYVKKLPKGNGTRAAVVGICGALAAGSGGSTGQGLGEMKRILSRKKYNPSYVNECAYPANWVQVMNPPDQFVRGEILNESDSRMKVIAEKISAGEEYFLKKNPYEVCVTKIISPLFRLFARRFLGKMFIADAKCTSCGLCVRCCPSETITLAGKEKIPQWGINCESCNRCMNVCPERSIQTSVIRLLVHGTGNVVIGIVSIYGAIYIQTYLFLPLKDRVITIVILSLAFYAIGSVLQISVFDAVLSFLQRIKSIRTLFSISYTRDFRRYQAPSFKPVMRK